MKIFKFFVNLLLLVILVIGGACIFMFIRGIQPYIVVSGSMEPAIPKGSLCFIDKRVSFQEISPGMVIAFKGENGTLITHRVSKKERTGLVTKGDANASEDHYIVGESSYVGLNIKHVKKVGDIIENIRNSEAKYLLIAGVLAVLIMGTFVNNSSDKKKA